MAGDRSFGKWAAGRQRITARIKKLADGRVASPTKFGVHASTEGFEYIIVVIMWGQVGKQVKAGGPQDPLQVLEARVSLPVLDGTDGAPRGPGPGGELNLTEPRELAGLDDECRRQGRHSPTRLDVQFVVFHKVPHVRADLGHTSSVSDPRRGPASRLRVHPALFLTGNDQNRRCLDKS